MVGPGARCQGRPAVELRIILVVALVQLVNTLDFMMVMPLGPDFAAALDIDQSMIGIIGGSYTAAAAVAGIVGAQLLDRFDRRRALVVAIIGLAGATALGGLATGLPTLLTARVLAGLFGGPATSLALAIVADTVPAERRGRAMGIVMASFSIASVLGVPAGLAMARHGDWRTPFFAVGVLGVVAAVIARSALPPLTAHLGGPRHARTRARDLLARPAMRWALGAAALLMLSVFMLIPSISPYLQNNLAYPRADIETLYLVGGLVNLGVLQLTGRLTDRIGPVPVSVAGLVVVSVSVVSGFLLAPPLLPVMAVFILFMASSSPRFVPLQTVATRLPAPHERAQYMSLQSAVQHLASSAGAGLSSLLLAEGPGRALIGMPLVAGLSLALALPVPILLGIAARAAAQARPGAGAP
ncbi:MAG: MFS transporter [Kofleriaceae bacterium]|nr:MFS transporter [Kofleriaceae bacterium]MBP6835811.1 MFS transporter [Kofleriaceae bacterium]MBP9206944.1 MFS transporter [Kofleriaceae bacterium]